MDIKFANIIKFIAELYPEVNFMHNKGIRENRSVRNENLVENFKLFDWSNFNKFLYIIFLWKDFNEFDDILNIHKYIYD